MRGISSPLNFRSLSLGPPLNKFVQITNFSTILFTAEVLLQHPSAVIHTSQLSKFWSLFLVSLSCLMIVQHLKYSSETGPPGVSPSTESYSNIPYAVFWRGTALISFMTEIRSTAIRANDFLFWWRVCVRLWTFPTFSIMKTCIPGSSFLKFSTFSSFGRKKNRS